MGLLGKVLTRRSRGRCELCEQNVQPRPYELPPFPAEPSLERTLMACASCRQWLETGKVEPFRAQFLSSAIWSNELAVRLAAARLLLAVNQSDDPWLNDTLEAANVDPDTGEFRTMSSG